MQRRSDTDVAFLKYVGEQTLRVWGVLTVRLDRERDVSAAPPDNGQQSRAPRWETLGTFEATDDRAAHVVVAEPLLEQLCAPGVAPDPSR